jgi:hypothetical protein
VRQQQQQKVREVCSQQTQIADHMLQCSRSVIICSSLSAGMPAAARQQRQQQSEAGGRIRQTQSAKMTDT